MPSPLSVLFHFSYNFITILLLIFYKIMKKSGYFCRFTKDTTLNAIFPAAALAAARAEFGEKRLPVNPVAGQKKRIACLLRAGE